jgi:hypothetical protein
MTRYVVMALLIGGALFLSGCAAVGGGLTSSTQPITEDDAYTVVAERVQVNDWGYGLMGLMLVPCDTWSAIQKAKSEHHADALINVTAEYQVFLLPLSIHRIILRGDAITFERLGDRTR